MKSYDKASWHIDGGEDTLDVVLRFKEVFIFLNEKDMLTLDGKETFEFGMDSSVSLNSTMVNKKGQEFLDKYYDIAVDSNILKLKKNLMNAYERFQKEEFL